MMGATSYVRLSESRRRGGAWAVLRRGLLRLCAARRQGRWAQQARRRRCSLRRVSAGCGYDAEGYARNFDDGVWKAEEGVSWMSAAAATGPSLGRAVSSVR
ncbi:unnamed protein product [Alopecurus aequalis]